MEPLMSAMPVPWLVAIGGVVLFLLWAVVEAAEG